MSGGNILQTRKKSYPLSDSGNPSCCRLCGPLKDVTHCKTLFKKATGDEELLAAAEAVYGRSLPRNELRPYERRLNNFRAFRAMITESQSHFERSEGVKRFIEVSPSAPRTLGRARRTKEWLVAVWISPSLLINKSYLPLKGGYKKKNIIFVLSLINQCKMGLTGLHDSYPTVRDICAFAVLF